MNNQIDQSEYDNILSKTKDNFIAYGSMESLYNGLYDLIQAGIIDEKNRYSIIFKITANTFLDVLITDNTNRCIIIKFESIIDKRNVNEKNINNIIEGVVNALNDTIKNHQENEELFNISRDYWKRYVEEKDIEIITDFFEECIKQKVIDTGNLLQLGYDTTDPNKAIIMLAEVDRFDNYILRYDIDINTPYGLDHIYHQMIECGLKINEYIESYYK